MINEIATRILVANEAKTGKSITKIDGLYFDLKIFIEKKFPNQNQMNEILGDLKRVKNQTSLDS